MFPNWVGNSGKLQDRPIAGGTANPEPGKSVYMMIPYQTLVPADEYADFVNRYVEPQLKFWVKSGIS